jgi:uncharacterized protein YyaL (SSP411 family)
MPRLMAEHEHTNRLINAASPYLLQHAHNPVDWYPWGEEALARARREDKPIFVSIGYSSCHWCHVMERESFENEDVARIMNEHFVCIKVDREERPDLDDVYMHAVQLMTGSGGWPMSVFLTPDLKPFYAGTYFPPNDAHGRPGFVLVLESVARAYREQREQVEQNTAQIMEAIGASVAVAEPGPLSGDLIKQAVAELERLFDGRWGGFGGAPKFPQTAAVGLLLRHHHRTGDQRALHVATFTLDAMARGGIYDQLGGGFHRYSVDERWLVPHFEKMLYDNALLAGVYLDAFQVTRAPLYERVARETLDYILREMADPGGGFHSAQDADTEGVEGTYYVWDLAEVRELLAGDDAEICRRYFGMTESGDFEGRNVLHAPVPPAEFAEQWMVSLPELEERLARIRAALLERRSQRTPPGKDDKVLADWNGLMIGALARGYQVLGDERYRRAAEQAATFIMERMTADGRLLHAHRAGRSHVDAFLDDHAFLTQAMLDLYQATFDARWVARARELAGAMIERFGDADAGGFFATPADQPDLIARSKRGHDGSIPSGNAVAAGALLRLARFTGERTYAEAAERTLAAFAEAARRSPTAFAGLLCALDSYLGPSREIVIAGELGDEGTQRLLAAAREHYLPNDVLALAGPEGGDTDDLPLLAGKRPVGDRPAAYVCRDGACQPPATSPEDLERLLAADSVSQQ